VIIPPLQESTAADISGHLYFDYSSWKTTICNKDVRSTTKNQNGQFLLISLRDQSDCLIFILCDEEF